MNTKHSLKVLYWSEIDEEVKQTIRTEIYQYKNKEHLVILVPHQVWLYEWDVVERLCYPFGSMRTLGPVFNIEGISHRSYILPKSGIDR